MLIIMKIKKESNSLMMLKRLKVFTKGKRKAIGTTGEKGLVSTFFANPFGPCQRKEKTITLIDYYFNFLKTNNIPIGVIYTQLGFEDKKSQGL